MNESYPKIQNVILVSVFLLGLQWVFAFVEVFFEYSFSIYISTNLLAFIAYSVVGFYAIQKSKIKIFSFEWKNQLITKFSILSLLLSIPTHIIIVFFLESLSTEDFYPSTLKVMYFAKWNNTEKPLIYLFNLFCILFTEEVFFRGFILKGLLKNYSPFISIGISTIASSFLLLAPEHLLFGIFIGYVYYISGNLYLVILIHALCLSILYKVLPILTETLESLNPALDYKIISFYGLDLIDIGGFMMLFILFPFFWKISRKILEENYPKDLA